jgi:hypothetical protein
MLFDIASLGYGMNRLHSMKLLHPSDAARSKRGILCGCGSVLLVRMSRPITHNTEKMDWFELCPFLFLCTVILFCGGLCVLPAFRIWPSLLSSLTVVFVSEHSLFHTPLYQCIVTNVFNLRFKFDGFCWTDSTRVVGRWR